MTDEEYVTDRKYGKSLVQDVKLSTGRHVKHMKDANGSTYAFATPGVKAMTKGEHVEYCKIRKQSADKAGNLFVS